MLLHHLLQQQAHDLYVLFTHLEQRIDAYVHLSRRLFAGVSITKAIQIERSTRKIKRLRYTIYTIKHDLDNDIKYKLAKQKLDYNDLIYLLGQTYLSTYNHIWEKWRKSAIQYAKYPHLYEHMACFEDLLILLESLLKHATSIPNFLTEQFMCILTKPTIKPSQNTQCTAQPDD